ncbi:cytochrome c biogenesis protein CcdA [Streptomyces sp. NBC_00370]|uniref:cytochrome c biogenesis protein CcdA n=1 Tax=Streptomyces sp. NBC_00370 TaxID=2975728 RepID=UPI002E2549DF
MVTLVLIGLVGGLITGISPCVLPVLPVVFLSGGVRSGERPAGRPGRRPYLIVLGLALSFSVFTLLGTLILSALPLPDDTVRWAGLVVLVVLGVAMMVPAVQHLLEKPFNWIPQRRVRAEHGGFVLGLALGAVYVPCAGPVLAAITVAGATGKIGVRTVLLTVAFAVGTALPLLGFALAGQGVAERVRAFRERQRGLRVLAGVVVIALAVALTFNVTDVLQRAVPDYTATLNNALDGQGGAAARLGGSGGSASLADCAQQPSETLEDCGKAPAISGIQQWLNTPNGAPVSASSLKGKVVLVDFWAYSCINCQRAITHVEPWYDTYQAAGFEVIGVHTPEYAFEHVPGNVAAGAKRLRVSYPVALDNKYTTWDNFGNDSWPAEYLIDAKGEVRHVAIGEGDYDGTEALIRQLLTAAHPTVKLPPATHVSDTTPSSPQMTPETYLGSERANTYAAGTPLPAGTRDFSYPASQPPNTFALSGSWKVGGEAVTAEGRSGVRLNYLANDIYLDVGGTGTVTAKINGRTTTYRISGAPDIYPLLSAEDQQSGTLDVTLSPGLSAYSFTFG